VLLALIPWGERVASEVPEWRIVPQALWDRAQVRLEALRTSPAANKARDSRFWEHRRPQHLLTGLVKCAVCGGNYAPSGRHYLSCSAAQRKGTCKNRKGIPRTVLEGLILDVLKRRLMSPELVKEFIRAYHAELNQQRATREVQAVAKCRELAEVERKLNGLIDAIAEGFRAPDLQNRLNELSQRKVKLEAEVKTDEAPLPRLHPRLADVYRKKVEQLHEALEIRHT
jgi:site-specific DNA recombinase